MTSVDRKSGTEGIPSSPWEAARFFASEDRKDPDEALYRVKITGTENAKGLAGHTFYGYFDTIRGEQTSLHLPILTNKFDLRRLMRKWKEEDNLYESVNTHTEGALALLNATSPIIQAEGITELQNLAKSTKIQVRSEQPHDSDALLFKDPTSIVITRPHLDLRFLPTTTPYAVERLVYGLSRDIPFLFKPLSKAEFYPDVERIFSKR